MIAAKFRSWQMPLMAINSLKSQGLKVVVVVPSATIHKPNDTEVQGTYEVFPRFQQLVKALGADRGIECFCVGDLSTEFEKGANYEDAKVVYKAMDDVMQCLVKDWNPGKREVSDHIKQSDFYKTHWDDHRFTDREVVVDITSGQKTATGIGVLVTLLRKPMRFQYVSTLDYQIRSYVVKDHFPDQGTLG